jgi:hypothetical protein
MSTQLHSGFATFSGNGQRQQFVRKLTSIDASLPDRAFVAENRPTIIFEKLTEEERGKVLAALEGIGRWVEDVQFEQM